MTSISYYDFPTESYTVVLSHQKCKIVKYHEYYKQKSKEEKDRIRYDANIPKETNIVVNSKNQHINVTKTTIYKNSKGQRLYFPHHKKNIHSFVDETGNMKKNQKTANEIFSNKNFDQELNNQLKKPDIENKKNKKDKKNLLDFLIIGIAGLPIIGVILKVLPFALGLHIFEYQERARKYGVLYIIGLIFFIFIIFEIST